MLHIYLNNSNRKIPIRKSIKGKNQCLYRLHKILVENVYLISTIIKANGSLVHSMNMLISRVC